MESLVEVAWKTAPYVCGAPKLYYEKSLTNAYVIDLLVRISLQSIPQYYMTVLL